MTRSPEDQELRELVAEEPFLRALARDLVADEADEVVQQTYLRALQRRPTGLRSPRQWLARIVRNVASDLRRGRRRRQDHEAAAAREFTVSSGELHRREERRAEVVAAVDALPEPMRTTAVLRYYDGLPPRQIARRLGLPVSTVWSRLHQALTRLRVRLDERHGGDRRAWLLPFLGLVPTPLPLLPPALIASGVASNLAVGVLSMTTKWKACAAVALVAVGAMALWTALGEDSQGPVVNREAGAPAVAGAAGRTVDANGADAGAVAVEPALREVALPAAASRVQAGTGALRVRVVFEEDQSPGAGLRLALRSRTASVPRALFTDAVGVARVEGLEPGVFEVSPEVNVHAAAVTEVLAGEEAEVVVTLAAGVEVDGVVVDSAGVPVAEATVLVGHIGMEGESRAVTQADAAGRFRLRGLTRVCRLGARAPGLAPSKLYSVHARDGSEVAVRLVMPGVGGGVAGQVFGADGEPVVGALVRVGTDPGETVVRPDGGFLRSASPFDVHTGAEGRFRAFGIAPGEQQLAVIATDYSPWKSSVTVPPNGTAVVVVRLDHGVRVTGVVRGPERRVLPNVRIVHGEGEARRATVSDEQGRFELDGLPGGELEVHAVSEGYGRATARLQAVAGQSLTWNPELSRGLELRGAVFGPKGEPLKGVMLIVSCRDRKWSAMAQTGAQGGFDVANCPAAAVLDVDVHHRGYRTQRFVAVDPRGGRLVVHLEREAAKSVVARGRVVGPDGLPVANATVMLVADREDAGGGRKMTGSDGCFVVGPTIPGTFQLLVRAEGYANLRTAARELAANEDWDAGDLTLQRGGHVEVEVTKLPVPDGTQFWVRDSRGRSAAHIAVSKGMMRSSPLAAGDYQLGVRGPLVAARVLPVRVEDGEVVKVEVTMQPGVMARFQVELPPGYTGRRYVRLTIRGGDGLATDRWRYDRRLGAIELQEALAPGDYTVEVRTAAGHRGAAEFSVGAQVAAGPVRLVLR